ncbi:MAG: metallophosphoesterase [Candidatus Omnitrophota bacterium]
MKPKRSYFFIIFILAQILIVSPLRGETGCLSPALSLKDISNWVAYSVDNHLIPKDTAAGEQDRFNAIARNPQELLALVKQEMAFSGSAELPKVVVMSDFHGAIKIFLDYISDALSRKLGVPVVLDHTEFPRKSIQQQLAEQGIDIRSIKNFQFYLLGDFMDRGEYGVKCFLAAEELDSLGLAKIVFGNHDVFSILACVGYHLPIYKGYNFYGHYESEQLVFSEHWDDLEISPDRFGWWQEKLVEYITEQKKLQDNFIIVNNTQVSFGQIREQLKDICKQVQSQGGIPQEQMEVLGDLAGFYFGTTDVYTGFNAVGMMSVQWWEERLASVDKFCSEAIDKELMHQLSIWGHIKQCIEEVIPVVGRQLQEKKAQGKWWWQVFNDINDQAYSSPEWYAQDWIFHNGWGGSVFKELNELDSDLEDQKWNASNFFRNPYLKKFTRFGHDKFTLAREDPYGFFYSHGWFPVNRQSGVPGFVYQNTIYSGEYLFSGLQIVEQDFRSVLAMRMDDRQDDAEVTRQLRDSVSLVISWYADKTIRIKPAHIRAYLDGFGLEAIQKSIGRHVWFTCHNPLNTLIPLGIGFSMQEGDYVHISVDKGMSWEKFRDVGGYVEVDASSGIVLRGYSGNDFTQIIDTPPAMVMSKDQYGQWYHESLWENKSVSRETLLPIAAAQLAEKLYAPEVAGSVEAKNLPPALSLIEQAI